MKGLYIGALMLALGGLAGRGAAQEVPVTGTVRAPDGTPVAQASVVVLGTGRGATSDGSGRFTVRQVPPGAHRLQVTFPGYAPVRRELKVEASGAAEVEVILTPSPLALPGMLVTATPGGRDALNMAQAAIQVWGAALERSLSTTVAQTLESQPGITTRYNGPAASMPVLRGVTGDRILILQDGQRAGDLSGSADDHAVTLDPLSAERIEVVRGPASLLYGTNALGGVVNVISGDIPGPVAGGAQWSASLQTESAFPGGGAQVRGVVPLGGHWAMMARGAGRSTGDVRIGEDPRLGDRLANTFFRTGNAAVGLGYSGPRVSGGASLQGYTLEHGVPTPPEDAERIRLTGQKLGGSGRLEISLGSPKFPLLQLRGAATAYGHDELEHDRVEMSFGLRTQTLDVLVRQEGLGPFSEGAWGASGLFRQYVATGEDQLTAPADSRTWGVFGYQELRVSEGGARLQLGGRVDRHGISSRDDPRFGPGVTRRFTAISGSAGLTVPLAAGVSGAVSAARAFRAPTVEEMFSDAVHLGTASYEVGDPSLRPETSEGVDAVVRVHRAEARVELAAFASRIGDFIHFEERGDTVVSGTSWPVLAYVQSAARFAGLEGQAEWLAAPHLVLGASGDLVRAVLADGSSVPYLPAARVSVSARWDDNSRSVGATVRHAFPQRPAGLVVEPPTERYTLIDLHAGLRLFRSERLHSLQLRVDNLRDTLYRDASSRIKSFAPNPGRNLSLLYRIHF